ncbi:hypothetical protein CVT24_011356 [Panaeolus cyanescens]|uniref:Cytochrome P450 n=1 Tax=Panaeolus cyanescens TaxID=181874 RepID=A0A409YGP5_9AGAR|nr:hypothetical protein CVT24_011356 [Panaeolus cyanescens]
MSSIMANLTLQNIREILVESNEAARLVSPFIVAVLVGAVAYRCLTPKAQNKIHSLGGIPVITAWKFFSKRYDFLWEHFNRISEPMFTFKVLHHNVVAVRGDDARKVFFDSKSLDFTEGYKILMGAAPRLSEVEIKTDTEGDVTWFNKQLAHLLNRNRLNDMLPSLMEDIDRRAQQWGTEGTMDPFQKIYDLVFQMTVRMTTCRELADDLDAIREMQDLYFTLEKSSTPQALLLPWFPSRSKRNKDKAVKSLFVKIYTIVETRRHATVPTSDAIDVLIAGGYGTHEIVQFVLGVIFAGVLNTGINACWSIVYVGMHPEWKTKVQKEIDSLIDQNTANSSDALHKRLSSIPVSAWEDEMPVFDSIIRETIRLSLTGTALRRNLKEGTSMLGRAIGAGDFLAYNVGDVHLNPDIYSQPNAFDPSRYGPGREEDKKATFAFLGWGAGRHPCTGMKVAKLEMKVIMAYMLAAFDYKIVDKKGSPLKTLPVPDRNDIHQARPIGEPFFVQFKRIVD